MKRELLVLVGALGFALVLSGRATLGLSDDLAETRATVEQLRSAVTDSPPRCSPELHGDRWPPWDGAARYRVCLVPASGRAYWQQVRSETGREFSVVNPRKDGALR